MKKILSIVAATALALSLTQATEHNQKHWDYSQNGPAHWGEFSKMCATGKAQSPINIVTKKTLKMDQNSTLVIDQNILAQAEVLDTGHSIKVIPKDGGSITIDGKVYKLGQFHFHGKSEHTVDGKQYDMVIHMVHQNPTTKQLAVIAVLIEEGEKSAALDTIIEGVGKNIEIKAADLLPANTEQYYHYVGSLTTPPCSEDVLWYVLKQPTEASKEQIEAFRKYYYENERPVQELNDREIRAN